MSIRFSVTLPPQRDGLGELFVIDTVTNVQVLGPFPCLGTSAGDTAGQHENPTRNPTKIFGHTPDGGYRVEGTLGPEAANTPARKSYGAHPRFRIVGISGAAELRQANIAAANEKPLRIHGGHQEGPYKPKPGEVGGFVVTNGCLRMADGDIARLHTYIRDKQIAYPFDMEVRSGPVNVPGRVFDVDDVEIDPGV
jgi:hypothetical protein